MFKLESYITPIILNHVAKYVKNIRPRDAQVSLWEGEVAFQNLDLRLDVLEDELNLPFTFLSGHIHELTIHVPWTKIASEPINVTINTIEFVLKLKEKNQDENSSNSMSLSQASVTDAQQQGFMPGLVQKIINNIVINCHNIILKYVEEDIVVSMNVQLLSLHSANEEWQPAFIEVNPLKFILRKLIQVSDLTICLDKRNSMGQIEICQEPILYRCSLELRIIYSTENKPITRIGISTQSMEINVSSLQFPMAMRLLALLWALKTGDLKKLETNTIPNYNSLEQNNQNNSNESYLSWAWNLLPNFSLNYEDEEIIKKDESGKILDIGIYIGYLQFTLKSSEFIYDSIVSTTKKIKYNSIMKITLAGIYSETLIANEKNWFNTKGGIAKISIEPLGYYANIDFGKYILSSDTELLSAYVDDSLFGDNLNDVHNFITNPKTYLTHVTEDYLRHRGACISFDMVTYKDIPQEDNEDSILNIAFNNTDKSISRLFLSSIDFKYNATFLKIYDIIQNLIQTYDYLPYIDTNPNSSTSKKESNISNDLIDNIVMKQYEFSMVNIHIDFILHEEKLKRSSQILDSKKMSNRFQTKIPKLVLKIGNIHGKWMIPVNMNGTVQQTCKMLKKSDDILNDCCNKLDVTFENISVELADNGIFFKIISIPKYVINVSKIISDSIAVEENIVKFKLTMRFDSIILKFNRPQLLIFTMIVKNTLNIDNFQNLWSMSRIDIHNESLKLIEITFNDIGIRYRLYKSLMRLSGHIKSFQGFIKNSSEIQNGRLIFQSIEHLTSNVFKKRWLQWTTQLPSDLNHIKHTPFIAIEMESFYVIISSCLLEFLDYSNDDIDFEIDKTDDKHEDTSKPTRTVMKSDRNSSRKNTFPQESIHFSSEKDDRNVNDPKVSISKKENSNNNQQLLNVLNVMIINIELNKSTLCILNEKIFVENISELLKSNNLEYMLIRLPKVTCTSAITDESVKASAFAPIREPSKKLKESFPWKCVINNFTIKNATKSGEITILNAVNTNITLHIRQKKEKIEFKHAKNIEKRKEDSKINVCEKESINQSCDMTNEPSEVLSIHSDKSEIETDITVENATEKDNSHLFAFKNSKQLKEKNYYVRSKVTIDLHIDTSPILIEIPKNEAEIIQLRLSKLFKAINLLKSKKKESVIMVQDNLLIVTNLEEDPSVKEFLEFDDTISQKSIENIDVSPNVMVFTIWLQWTITKFAINFEGSGILPTKLTLELEDLITSFDRQIDFTKVKNKIGSLSVRYFQLNERKEWIANDSLKIKMGTENSQSPMFDSVITFAETDSFFKKIGARNKTNNVNSILSEIIISTEAIEILLDMEQITDFMPIFCAFVEESSENIETIEYSNSKPLVVSDLPLIYLDSKGFTIYTPIKSSNKSCDVFIFKVTEINITTKVENPLNRLPIRPDIYTKAAQMGILNTPGSLIEDRQYEIRYKNISAATGNWREILKNMKTHTDNFHNTNPAFDWNNRNQNDNLLELRQIFGNVIVSVIYAPCISYHNILVCGQAIELNFMNDLVATVTTDQLTLFSCMINLMKNMQDIFIEIPKKNINKEVKVNGSSSESILYTNISMCDSYEYYSCADTLNSQRLSVYEKLRLSARSTSLNVKSQTAKLPYDISFVGGIFIVKLYKLVKPQESRELILGYDYHSNTCETLAPLIAFTLFQPSFLVSQKVYKFSIQMTLFNFSICTVHPEKETYDQNLRDFPLQIFVTKPGELNSSGIPPALLTIKMKKNQSQKCEIDCLVAKPCTFLISHIIIENLTRLWILLNEAFLLNICLYTPRPILRGNKIQKIRHLIFDSDNFNLKINKFIVNIFQKELYEVIAVLNNFECSLNFVERLDKMTLISNFDSFYIQTQTRICLHPFSLKLLIDVYQESWQKLPFFRGDLSVNVIQADIGVENIKNIVKLKNNLMETINLTDILLTDMEENVKKTKTYANVKKAKLEMEVLPEVKKKQPKKHKDEFYRDDLRAGAFQFIEIDNDSSLPLPYQIQIIEKNYGIICWRYPQPRQICNLQIYPVPMPIVNPAEIKCQMQYYSLAHKSFRDYCEFHLSETEILQVTLPEQVITANIWRVKILQHLVSVDRECFEDEDDDQTITPIKIEDILSSQSDSQYSKLHPKVLVGCMRIDTIFNPDLLPKSELLINISKIEINFQTQQDSDCVLPVPFKQFKILSSYMNRETFLSLAFTNIEMYTKVWSHEKFMIQLESEMHIKCLDYGFYSIQYLMEDSQMKFYINFNEYQKNISMVFDIIKFNYGPSFAHTIVTSINQWNNLLAEKDINYPIFGRFIIMNRVNFPIIFGQDGTNERIKLERHDCIMYSFNSDNFEQKLIFYVKDETNKSNAVLFSDDNNLLKYIKCGKYMLVIRLKKLSSTQLLIFLKGQIEIVSMIDTPFLLQFNTQKSDAIQTVEPEELFLTSYDRVSLCMNVSKNTEISFRIKYQTKHTKIWSGDIPLRSNKNLPWLVKVPISGQNDFVSYWIRIVREDITEMSTSPQTPLPQRILIMMWPVFILRSFYPSRLVLQNEMAGNNNVIEEKGQTLQLNLPATHQTKHEIDLTDNFPNLNKELCKFEISLASINWNDFFYYDKDQWNIDQILGQFVRLHEINWPCSDNEELLVNRNVENALQVTPVYNTTSNKLVTACSIMIDIAPTYLCINSLATSLRILNPVTGKHTEISPNSLSEIDVNCNGFKIEIESLNGRWLQSSKIYLNSINMVNSLKQTIDNEREKALFINDDEQIEIMLENLKNFVYKIILKCLHENGRRCFIVKSAFVVVNYSDHMFNLIPFCIRKTDKISQSDVENVIETYSFFVPKHVNENNCKGQSLEYFHYLSAHKYHERYGDLSNLMFFVCIKSLKSKYLTLPISLSTTYNRKCLNFHKLINTIALSVNVLEKNGQYYLSIFNDCSPAVLLTNETELNFYVGQAITTDQNTDEKPKTVTITPEVDETIFDWHQVLRSKSILFYTPPEMYLNFPDVMTIIPNISIAISNDKSNNVFSNNSIRWSMPISTNSSYEQYFHVPLHGDVKVIVCNKHKTVKISIYYIAEEYEFSVKDLRSRLKKTKTVELVLEENIDKTDSIHSNSNKILKAKEKPKVSCHHSEILQVPKPPDLQIHLFIKRFTLNLFQVCKDKVYMKTEICSAHLDDVNILYDAEHRAIKFFLANLQIDNQLFTNGNYDFPVILCSQNLYKYSNCIPSVHTLMNDFSKLGCASNALIQVHIKFYRESENYEIRSLFCHIGPIRAYIEDSYLNTLFEHIEKLSPSKVTYRPKEKVTRENLKNGFVIVPKDIQNQAQYLAKPFKLQSIKIAPINVLLSAHTCIHLYIALDHSPLEFSIFEQTNILTLPINFGYTLGKHYISGALFGAGWVVGSLEILGSPSGLARSFSLGLRDFISMPVQGLLSGPWGLIVGITQGSMSLLLNITAGTVNSVTKLAASVARNIDRFTLDEEHFKRTEALRRYRPNGFAEGFSQGLTGLGISILGALGGISRHPLEAKSSVGVLTGLGRGIVGALTKPISGAAELVALTGQGVLHTVGFNSMPRQIEISTIRNIAIYPAEGKIWKLLPKIFSGADQILFYNEATLVVHDRIIYDKYRKVMICMTLEIFIVLDMEKHELTYCMPIDKIKIDFDEEEQNLINVTINEFNNDDLKQDSTLNFTKQRIMNFIKSSEQIVSHHSLDASEDIDIDENRKLDFSFYISKPLGKHLLEYIATIHSKIST